MFSHYNLFAEVTSCERVPESHGVIWAVRGGEYQCRDLSRKPGTRSPGDPTCRPNSEALSPTLHPGPRDYSSFRFHSFGLGCWGFSLSCLWSLSGMNSGEGSSVERERDGVLRGTDGEAPSEQELASRAAENRALAEIEGHAEDLSWSGLLAPKDQ